MRYPKRKLVLFFAVQALGVAVMIALVAAGRGSVCRHEGCYTAPPLSVIVSLPLILGELWVIAGALRVQPRVWRSLLGLGLVFLVAAAIAVLSITAGEPHQIASLLAVWHLVVGLLLLATGAAAGFADLLERWRRSDQHLPEDEQLSQMWPFD